MKVIYTIIILGSFSLAGCSREGEEQAVTTTQAPISAAVSESEPREAVSEEAKPIDFGADRTALVAGYVPTFAHKISSTRADQEQGGKVHNVVIIDALNSEQDSAIRSLERDAIARGAVLEEISSVDGKSRRFHWREPGSSAMTVVVNERDERGRTIVYFGWRE